MEKPDNNENKIVREAEVTAPASAVPDLKASVFDKIAAEEVKPRAKWVYSTQEYAVWVMWVLTVILGAISIAVALFVVSHQRFALYELTHRDFVTFAVDVLPALWLILFVVLVAFAVFNLRQTKRGYRYPLWQILGSSLILSLAFGALLHISGVGFSMDKMIGAWAKSYPSQEKMELRWWQNPDEGRLVGTMMMVRESANTAPRFIDAEGTAWQLELEELQEWERGLMERGEKVRVFGRVVSAETNFHVCGAMPFVLERRFGGEELDEIRKVVRAKIDSFREEKLFKMASSTTCVDVIRSLPKPAAVGW